MADFITKDSGARQEFITGSRRDTESGKGRYDLVPPLIIKRYAQLLERGAEKYGAHNWEKGQPISRAFSSAFRHLMQFRDGQFDEDHLAAVIFNVGVMMFVLDKVQKGELPADLIDLLEIKIILNQSE